MNIRKITALAGSVLMAGLTVTTAAAASYPAPFVENGVADVAIVYGTGAGVSSLDQVQAGNIQASLGTYAKGTVSVEGGEAFKLEKSSENFNFGDALNSTYSDLDDEDMDFLADGTYDDGDIDEDYEQSITLGGKTLGLFADNDYNDDEPTVGFKWTNGEEILSYTIEFDESIVLADMVDTELPLMGGNYYVLAASSSQIDVLDSAEKVVISEGETITVGDKQVKISFMDSDEVNFDVDGELTDEMNEHDYEELEDGSYIVVNDIMYSTKEGTVGKVEFSIGAGKMELITDEDVEVNDEDVDGLQTTITTASGNTSLLDSITLTWNSDDETFLTEEDVITMPGFEKIQLAFGGLAYPADSETISLDNGETMTLNMDNFDLPLFHFAGTNGASSTMGDEDYALVTSVASVSNYTGASETLDAALTTGLDLVEDNRFIATRIDEDLGDVETMYYEVTNIEYDGTDILVELEDLIGDKNIEFDSLESKDNGDITVTLEHVNNTRAYLTFSAADGTTIEFNKVVSDKGLVVTLPAAEGADTVNLETGVTLTFQEADKDEDVETGATFNATVKATSNDKIHVSTHTVDDEEESDDQYVGYVSSDLASKIMYDTSADENDFSIEYFGKEVTADVQVVAGGDVSTSTSALGDVLVTDSEVSTVSASNLVIVGGSCINSAAATVLGGAYCGAAFTDATGVGANEFLIKGFEDSAIDGKFALVVAGYEAADTVNAATYLTNKDVDTSKAYKGTSATEASVIVA